MLDAYGSVALKYPKARFWATASADYRKSEGIAVSHAGAEPARRQQSVGLTNSQLRILGYIASCGAQGCSDTKNAIAEKLGVCPKTVDRAVRRMRDDGLIVSTARFDENGSQLGNVYFIGAGSKQ